MIEQIKKTPMLKRPSIYIRMISERGSHEDAKMLSQSIVGIDAQLKGSSDTIFIPWTSILYIRYND